MEIKDKQPHLGDVEYILDAVDRTRADLFVDRVEVAECDDLDTILDIEQLV